MKKQGELTHKEAVKKALEELGGRARLKDIYPRVIPLVKYKPGSDIKATLRRLLQTTPELFRPVEGMKGWWELVSYRKELADKDKKIAELTNSNITKDGIINAFNGFDSFWENAYKDMKSAGYFKDIQPQIILNHPQFGSLYEVKGNKEVKIGKDI